MLFLRHFFLLPSMLSITIFVPKKQGHLTVLASLKVYTVSTIQTSTATSGRMLCHKILLRYDSPWITPLHFCLWSRAHCFLVTIHGSYLRGLPGTFFFRSVPFRGRQGQLPLTYKRPRPSLDNSSFHQASVSLSFEDHLHFNPSLSFPRSILDAFLHLSTRLFESTPHSLS